MIKKISLTVAALALCVVSVTGCGGVDNTTSKPDVNLGEAKEVDKNQIEGAKKDMKGKKSFTTADGEMGGATTRPAN